MFSNVLEYVPTNSETFDNSHQVVKNIHTFLEKNYAESGTIGVSLSGGVDSMVILSILYNLGYPLSVLHINYGNRPESGEEADFIKYYCNKSGIDLIYHEMDIFRETTDRRVYESATKHVRFNLYSSMLMTKNAIGICLGHHDGDIIENIFNNFIGGQSLLDLQKIKPTNIIDKVPIWRPLIGVEKSAIFDYAHANNIPYFKNTTPLTSCRGMMREQIFPMLEQYNKGIIRNLRNIGQQSDEWGDMIRQKILDPFLNKNVTISDNKIIIKISEQDLTEFPIIFWHTIINQSFHNIELDGVSRKSINNLILKLKRSYSIHCKIPIKKQINTVWDCDYQTLTILQS